MIMASLNISDPFVPTTKKIYRRVEEDKFLIVYLIHNSNILTRHVD